MKRASGRSRFRAFTFWTSPRLPCPAIGPRLSAVNRCKSSTAIFALARANGWRIMNSMKSAATIRQVAPQTANAADDWHNEPWLLSDLEAAREGDRAMKEGRCISDAEMGRQLRALKRKLERQRGGGSK